MPHAATKAQTLLAGSLLVLWAACTPVPKAAAVDGEGLKAFAGARIVDGTGAGAVEGAGILVREGRIEAIGANVEIPEGVETVDLTGKFVVPGFINAHGHVGGVRGLELGHYTEDNLLDQLGLYARYGITTVNSLGGDGPEAVALREAQDASLDRARIFLAGAVVAADTIDEARSMVDANAELGVDVIKIRVDDNLGTTKKMAPEIYRAVIDRAHEKGLRVASHLFYLEDAHGLLEAGTDFVAHSVRDREVDEELVSLLKEKDVCYCPTLTREVSTFVYEEVPEFFEDPFFLKEADTAVLEQLKDPERMRSVRDSPSARRYKTALEIAMKNLKIVADGGATVAFGTDTGPPARFQGYFEHMEMAMMAEAGLTPAQIITSATGDAARCLGFYDVGTLAPGKWADFVVLDADPLADIKNMRQIDSVWIAGNRVPAGLVAARLVAGVVAGSQGSDEPIVIAHRGASGHRPEHTLEAYRLAIEQGADYIEPDLVATRDGVLVARHENEITETTDVADHPELADRRTTKTIDSREVTGWFTEDFTLEELKTLRARERLSELRSTDYDGRYEVPTLQEILELLHEVNGQPGRTGRRVGLYPETKHPSYFAKIGLPLEEPLVEALHRAGWRDADDPVFIQSFEVGNLKKLQGMTRLPLVQLVPAGGRPPDLARAGDPRTYADLVTREGLAEIATYAEGVGVHKRLVLPPDAQGALGPPTALVSEAHRAGLLVHVWTLRAENAFLPAGLQKGEARAETGDMRGEALRFLEAGVDGFFTDHPDVGVAARDAFIQSGRRR